MPFVLSSFGIGARLASGTTPRTRYACKGNGTRISDAATSRNLADWDPTPLRHLIKRHRVQLASDRTSCQTLANQFRLVLHIAAYWLMLALRDAVPRRMLLH